MIDKALPARGPAGGLCHSGLDGGFVDEGQPFQMIGPERLAFGDPDMALLGDIPVRLIRRLQACFCVTGRACETGARPKNDGHARRVRWPFCRPFINRKLGPDGGPEFLKAIVCNDDNLSYGLIIRRYTGPEVTITALTDDGRVELKNMD